MMPVRRTQSWLPSIFNDFFDNDWMVKANATAPAINVFETEKEYKVELAAPGMTKEDFNVRIDEDNNLVISMEKKTENKEEKKEGRYLRREFSYSKFQQTMILPDNVDKEKISAAVENGVLSVQLPKISEEDVKDKLFIRVSSAEANKEVLENAPHQLKEDLAITYHVAVGKDQDGLSSMFIKNDLLEQYGISAEQLHEDAMKSSPRVMVPEVSSIGALIDEMYQKNILMLTPDEREMLQETLQESSEMPTFFVVTNTERIDGAGVIFYPEFMDNMGELLGNDFFILPSSIHQMLVFPDDGQVDAEMLRDMVKEVNATQVAPAERLTNDVYHFDTKDHVFEKADRFTERQKEKEAQAAKTEKAGKEQPDKKPKAKKHDMEL